MQWKTSMQVKKYSVPWWVYVPADFDTKRKSPLWHECAEKGLKTGLLWSIADLGSPVLLYEVMRFAAIREWQLTLLGWLKSNN